MQVIAKLVSGSKLYGTAIVGSDTDYRGVYLPTKAECYLGRVKETVEDKTEEDTTYFSLQRFMDLASQGQSIAIEMLATPFTGQYTIDDGDFKIWKMLRDNRKLFYTKNMHAFLGFAKSMSGKYSSRVDRLNEAEAILHVFESTATNADRTFAEPPQWKDSVQRLADIWDLLPESTNAIKTINTRNISADNRVYQVCGRELQATITLAHAFTIIMGIYSSYGDRVRAAKGGQIEWKSLMHAFRVAMQAKEIVETGDLVYPLKDAVWLKSLRMGEIDFMKSGLDKRLDDLIIEVQEKMDKSNLPERVDKAWVDNFILEVYQ